MARPADRPRDRSADPAPSGRCSRRGRRLARSVADLLTVADDVARATLAVAADRRRRTSSCATASTGSIERLEEAIGAIVAAAAPTAAAQSIGPAVPALAAVATGARWELHGALAAARRRGPGTPIRAAASGRSARPWATSSSGQRSYGWFNAWYLEAGVRRRRDASVPPDGVLPPEPDRGGRGGRRTRADVRAPARRRRRPRTSWPAAGLDAAAMRRQRPAGPGCR